MLGTLEYGKFTLAMNTILTIGNFFALPITAAISKYLAQSKDDTGYFVTDELMTKLFGLITVVYILTIIFIVNVEVFIPSLNEIKDVLLIGSVYIPVSLLISLYTGIKYVNRDYSQLAISLVLSVIVQLPVLYFCSKYYGIYGAIISYTFLVCSQLVILVRKERIYTFPMIWFRVKRFVKEKKRKNSRIISKFILPNTLSAMIVPIIIWKSNLVVVKNFGYEELGFITVCLQMQVVINFLPSVINSMILPRLSKSYSLDKRHYMKDVKKLFVTTMVIAGGLSAIIFLGAAGILNLYSDRYVEYADIMRVFCVAFFISTAANVVGQVILSAASIWWGVFLNVIWGGIFIISLVYFVKNFGLIGLSYAYLLSYLVHLITTSIYIFYFLSKTNNEISESPV